jgi:hypothetical protein
LSNPFLIALTCLAVCCVAFLIYDVRRTVGR